MGKCKNNYYDFQQLDRIGVVIADDGKILFVDWLVATRIFENV